MAKDRLSAFELYMNRVFKPVIMVCLISAVLAGVTFTVVKLAGFYPDLSPAVLMIFDLSTIAYFIIGLLICRNCTDETGELKPKVLLRGKIFLVFVCAIQWNFLSYMAPSRDFWAFGLFFITLSTLFLDHRFVLIVIGEILVSIAISWFIRGDILLPVKDSFFQPNLMLRCLLLLLGSGCLWLLTYLVETYLVKELERLADYDPLTGLHNRRSLNIAIESRIKGGQEFTLLMCDLDDFKKFNDQYGHDCGDELLRMVSTTILRSIRSSDMAFRYGGEEIVVLLDGDERNTLVSAERLRRLVSENAVYHQEQRLSITMTVGAAASKGKMSADELIRLADQKMYAGKQSGKNKVVS